ncbi:MAG: WD40 repeat domain-containing protein, partial [Chloroflexi bacterium]|nr:WD40 repeat domain-containing protein [Chloroflexota bacterium]
ARRGENLTPGPSPARRGENLTPGPSPARRGESDSPLPFQGRGAGGVRWANLPLSEPYLWDHLTYHLLEAGRGEELIATVKDLRYLAVKTLAHKNKAHAAEADLAAAVETLHPSPLRFGDYRATSLRTPDDAPLRLLKRNFANAVHLLNRCETLNDIGSTLHSRSQHLSELADECERFERELPRPYITAWRPLPDLLHPALIRTLSGHTGPVFGCAVSPDGEWIASASNDNTLKVWDARTGEAQLTLQGHTSWVTGCAVSPNGERIASASYDHTLKVWDARTGKCVATIRVDGLLNACAFHPDGEHIVATGAAGVYWLRWVRGGGRNTDCREREFVPPPVAVEVGATFGGQIKLWGYDLVREGNRLELKVQWGAVVRPEKDYKFFLHLLGTDEQPLAQTDGMPRNYTYPTSQWLAGEVVSDTLALDLTGVPPGEYRLAPGWYDPQDPAARLEAVDAQGQPPGGRVLLPEGIR